jgi:hypothetical protein
MKARAVIEAETPKAFIKRSGIHCRNDWQIDVDYPLLTVLIRADRNAELRIAWHEEEEGYVDCQSLTVTVETDRPRFERACQVSNKWAEPRRHNCTQIIKHWADEILK